jgi:uncharacterized membrane protein YidH (DUF202 family)
MAAEPPRDPGLQAERTSLAWNRTGMALCANGLLALRAGLTGQRPGTTLLAAVILAASALVMLAASWRKRRLCDGDVRQVPAALMAGVVAAGGLACAASVLPHLS